MHLARDRSAPRDEVAAPPSDDRVAWSTRTAVPRGDRTVVQQRSGNGAGQCAVSTLALILGRGVIRAGSHYDDSDLYTTSSFRLTLVAGAATAARSRILWAVTPRSSMPIPHFFFNDTATTEIYTLSLHDALPI